jgi:hypothetical protein
MTIDLDLGTEKWFDIFISTRGNSRKTRQTKVVGAIKQEQDRGDTNVAKRKCDHSAFFTAPFTNRLKAGQSFSQPSAVNGTMFRSAAGSNSRTKRKQYSSGYFSP